MLRRRVAAAAWAAARWAGRGSPPAASPAGLAGSVQQSLAAAGDVAGSSWAGGAALQRWRHGLGAAARRAAEQQAAAAAAAAGRAAPSRGAALQQARWRGSWTDRSGYSHFQGRGAPRYAVVYSRDSRRRALRWLAVLGGGGAIIWVRSRQEVPYTRRMHAIIISPETEAELGEETYRQVLAEARARGQLLPPNHRAVQAVRRVGTRIAQAATDGYGGGFQEHLRGLQWEFSVIHSDQVNAFVVPGGKVVVYTGLLRLARSEDELAAVLAHESAHVVARHAAERITQMGAVEVARTLIYWFFGLALPSGPLTAIFFLPNSRKAETEADAIGLQIMSRACYNPAGMASMFSKMAEAERREGGDRVPGFLRTHPHSADRVRAITEMLPEAEALREMSGCEAAGGDLQAALRRVASGVDWGA